MLMQTSLSIFCSYYFDANRIAALNFFLLLGQEQNIFFKLEAKIAIDHICL